MNILVACFTPTPRLKGASNLGLLSRQSRPIFWAVALASVGLLVGGLVLRTHGYRAAAMSCTGGAAVLVYVLAHSLERLRPLGLRARDVKAWQRLAREYSECANYVREVELSGRELLVMDLRHLRALAQTARH